MPSAQTLSLDDRRLVAAWAADCAERVLPLFEAEAPEHGGPRDAIDRARAFAAGRLDAAGEIRRRFDAGHAARVVREPGAVAAARSAAQAAAVAHMGAHALGAAAYAATAAASGSAEVLEEESLEEEVRAQLDLLTPAVRAALARLPLLGADSAGPLGTGLLARSGLGTAIRLLQAGLR